MTNDTTLHNHVSFQQASLIVKQRLDVLDVVSRHVSLRKAGRNYTGLCPFHKEKTPSFSVNPAKQLFKCFGCGEGGDTLAFLMKINGQTFGQVIREQALEMGILIQDERGQGESYPQSKLEQDKLYELNMQACVFYQQERQKSLEIQAYLEKRGFGSELSEQFGLGFAPKGWENLLTHLHKVDPSLAQQHPLIEKAGLLSVKQADMWSQPSYYDRFRHRLMIPIFDEKGRVVAFGGRALSDDDEPKYLNSSESPIYNKSRLLYGLNWAQESIRESTWVVVMEGYFDVMSAHSAGVTQAVGVCGTALTSDHLRLLRRYGVQSIYLCFDTDAAGNRAALRAIENIEQQLLDDGFQAFVLQLPDGKDPDDFFRQHSLPDFEACRHDAVDVLTFKFDMALATCPWQEKTPMARLQTVQTVVPLLMAIKQPILQQEFIRRIADRIQMSDETLALELKRASEKRFGTQAKKVGWDQAIFDRPRPYIKKHRQRSQSMQAKSLVDDVWTLKTGLSIEESIEKKENELISLLLMGPTAYDVVMTVMNNSELMLQNPKAFSVFQLFSSLVEACRRETTLINWSEVVDRLQVTCLQKDMSDVVPFITERLLDTDNVAERYNFDPKGLQSVDYREKLNRVVFDIAGKIHQQREQINLTELIGTSPERPREILPRTTQARDTSGLSPLTVSEATDDLDVQLQLREALLRRQQMARSRSQPSVQTNDGG